MHLSIQSFVSGALSREEVEGKTVLEVGSMDVNGSIRPLVEALKPSSYLGVDVAMGPRVDRVIDAVDLYTALGEYADVTISTETLEHVLDWRASVYNLMAVTKPGGLLVLTTRSPGFHYHPFPEDRWRYTPSVIQKILEDGGFQVLTVVSDQQAPGVFVKARKPSTWFWNGNDPLDVWADPGVEAVPQATSGLAECDVVIPTLDNPNQLGGLLFSLFREMDAGFKGRIIVVNNGTQPIEKSDDPRLVILNPGTNLGWTGGLALGLMESTAPYVIFANDDTFIPESSRGATLYMLREMLADDTIGAVGPSTNICIGGQRMETQTPTAFDAPYLIFFFTLFRRSAIDAVGGIDTNFVTADDMDLSLRLRKAGHRLLVRKDIYVHHYAFQTGIRVYGDHTRPGGWNSQQMLDAAMAQLQKKHGNDALDFLSLRLKAPA